MRTKKPLERFDPTTGWPLATYPGFVEAAAAGYNRGSIHLVLRGKRATAGGFGWRLADECSRLPEFVALWCHRGPDAEAVGLREFGLRFQMWVGREVDQSRLRRLVKSRYGIEWWNGPTTICQKTGTPRASGDRIICGLVWAA